MQGSNNLERTLSVKDNFTTTFNRYIDYLQRVKALDNDFSRGAERSARSLENVKKQMSSLATQAIGFTTVVTAFTAITKEVLKTEQAMVNLKKVMSSDTNFTGLLKEARKMASAYGVAVQDVLVSMENSGRVLKDAARTIQATEAAIKNSIAGNMSLESSTNYLMASLNQFQLSASFAENIGDTWNNLANNYATTNEELAIGFTTAGAAAKQAGVDYKQLASALTVLNTAGIGASEGSNALTVFFNRMRSDKAVGVLKQIGIEVTNVTGEYKGAMEVLSEVAEKFKTLGDVDQQTVLTRLAGQHQYKRLVPLLQNWDLYKKVHTDAISNSDGSMDQEVATQLDQTKKALQGLKTEFNITLNLLGENFIAQPFRETVEQLRNMLEYLNLNEDELKNVLNVVTSIGKQFVVMSLASKSRDMLATLREAGRVEQQKSAAGNFSKADRNIYDLQQRRSAFENAITNSGSSGNSGSAGASSSNAQLKASLASVNAELEREQRNLLKARAELESLGNANLTAATKTKEFAARQALLNLEMNKTGAKSATPAVRDLISVVEKGKQPLNAMSLGLAGASRGIKALTLSVKGFMLAVPEMLVLMLLWEVGFKAIEDIWDSIAEKSRKVTEQIKKETNERIEAGTKETNEALKNAKSMQENYELLNKMKEDVATKKSAGIDTTKEEAVIKNLEQATDKQVNSMIRSRDAAAKLASELENLRIKRQALVNSGQSTDEIDVQIKQREKEIGQNKITLKDLDNLKQMQQRKKKLKDQLADPRYANAAAAEIIEINNQTASIREQTDAYIALNNAKSLTLQQELTERKNEVKKINDRLFLNLKKRDAIEDSSVSFQIGSFKIKNRAEEAQNKDKIEKQNNIIQQDKKKKRETEADIIAIGKNLAGLKQAGEILAELQNEVKNDQTVTTGGNSGNGGSNKGKDKPEYTWQSYALQKWMRDVTITSLLGNRNHPILKVNKYHDGMDFVSPSRQFTAPFDGKILSAGKNGGYGNKVVILANDGKTKLAMSHLADGTLKVKAGDLVNAGQLIGDFGDTGNATGIHGHMQLYKNNKLLTDNSIYKAFLKSGAKILEKTSAIKGTREEGTDWNNVGDALDTLRQLKETALTHNSDGSIAAYKDEEEILEIQKDYVKALAEYKQAVRENGANEKEMADIAREYTSAVREMYSLEDKFAKEKIEAILKKSEIPMTDQEKDFNFLGGLQKKVDVIQDAFIVMDKIDDNSLRRSVANSTNDSFNNAINSFSDSLREGLEANLKNVYGDLSLNEGEKKEATSKILNEAKNILQKIPVISIQQKEQLEKIAVSLEGIKGAIEYGNTAELNKHMVDLELGVFSSNIKLLADKMEIGGKFSEKDLFSLEGNLQAAFMKIDNLVEQKKITYAEGNTRKEEFNDQFSQVRQDAIISNASNGLFGWRSTNSAMKQVNAKYDQLAGSTTDKNQLVMIEKERQEAINTVAEKGKERALAIQQSFNSRFNEMVRSGGEGLSKAINDIFKDSMINSIESSMASTTAKMSQSLSDNLGIAGDLIGGISGSFFGAGMGVLINKLFGGKGDGETDRLTWGSDNWSHRGNGTDYATTDNIYTPAITKESVKIINFNNTFNITTEAVKSMSNSRIELERVCREIITKVNRENAKMGGVRI